MSDACAVYGGTFDPVTLGHLDLIRRAAAAFDRVCVCVATSGKDTHFSIHERIGLLRPLVADLENVQVGPFEGLLVLHARELRARFLVRSIRGPRDYEFEMQMAFANHDLAPDVETVFLPPSPATALVSSTLVREVASLGGDVSAWVPPSVADALRERPPSV